MTGCDYLKAVEACYSTWAATYYDNYYGPQAGYPPVHRTLLKDVLLAARPQTLLDAGCGPGSFLREIAHLPSELFGFDLTPEMVAEARRVLEPLGVPPSHLWQGNVLNPNSFRPPGGGGPDRFEAVLCIGVLPHIPPADDETVLRNLGRVVAPGGLAVLEARNQLFSLFTLNRYTYQFFVEELLRLPEVKQGYEHPAGGWELLEEGLKQRFRLDLPPLRRGQAGEPGYDEVLSRQHNPLVLQQQFAAAGFSNIEVLFYHYHALPPMFEAQMPEVFRRASLALENPRDWRGYFMASAFLLSGRRT